MTGTCGETVDDARDADGIAQDRNGVAELGLEDSGRNKSWRRKEYFAEERLDYDIPVVRLGTVVRDVRTKELSPA